MPTEDSKDALLERLGRTKDWSIDGRDFREIFSEFYPLVLRYFVRHGFGEEDSRDLAQETMLRVYRSLSSYSGDAQLGTWIFQVTANVCRNAVRTRASHKRSAPEDPRDERTDRGGDLPDDGEGPLRELLTGERAKILTEALQDLPPQMRRCVELRVQRDLTYREIAEILRISLNTVKAQLFQARQILRSRLAGYFDEGSGER